MENRYSDVDFGSELLEGDREKRLWKTCMRNRVWDGTDRTWLQARTEDGSKGN